MDESANRRSRFATILLVALTAWAVLSRPGGLGSGPFPDLRLLAALAGFWTLFLSEWLIQGWLLAAGVSLLFLLSPKPLPANGFEALYLRGELFFVALFGMVLLVWAELGKPRRSVPFWSALTVGVCLCWAVIWAAARQTSDWSAEFPSPTSETALQRVRHAGLVLTVGGGLLGAWLAYRRRRIGRESADGRTIGWAAALAVLAPAVGFGLARLFVPVAPEQLLAGAKWGSVFGDLGRWFGHAGWVESLEGWCWAPPGVIVPLSAAGLVLAALRGRRQWSAGLMPLAWLLTLFAVLVVVAVLPLTTSAAGSAPLTLVMLAALLPVFAVADCFYRVGERLALQAPPPGPSNIPRV